MKQPRCFSIYLMVCAENSEVCLVGLRILISLATIVGLVLALAVVFDLVVSRIFQFGLSVVFLNLHLVLILFLRRGLQPATLPRNQEVAIDYDA